MDDSDLWRLALLALCLILSGFFSASETAYIALSRVRLMHLVKTKRRGALRVERLLQRPDRFLATVLLGNNLVNTAAAVLATVLTIKLIGEGDWAVVVSTLSVTIFLLVFGETFPKSVAWHRSEMVAFAVSRPLTLMGLALTPAVRMLQVVSYLGSRLAGGRDVAHQMGEQEIRTLISAGAQSGAVEPGEAAMLEKVFHFGDRQVREIMTPRPEIVWIESSTTLDGFLKSYVEHSHTRFPVFDGFIENVVGILSIKEVMLALSSGRGDGSSFVADFLRPAYFVPETKTVSSTFDEARQGGHSLVLTVDEFGGIAGLCTVKQLVEVVVGQVWEEGAEIEEVVTPVDEHTFRLDAGAGVNEINEELDLDIPEGDYQTVAGFLLDSLGRIPDEGDVVEFRDLKFTVMAMAGVKIEEVELRKTVADHPEADR